MGERDLATSGAHKVVVDDDAIIDEQLCGERANARRGRDGEARLHVRDDPGGRAAKDGDLALR